jgi:hypothetical protein
MLVFVVFDSFTTFHSKTHSSRSKSIMTTESGKGTFLSRDLLFLFSFPVFFRIPPFPAYLTWFTLDVYVTWRLVCGKSWLPSNDRVPVSGHVFVSSKGCIQTANGSCRCGQGSVRCSHSPFNEQALAFKSLVRFSFRSFLLLLFEKNLLLAMCIEQRTSYFHPKTPLIPRVTLNEQLVSRFVLIFCKLI